MARPRVTLKLATSMDGRIALSNGVSQWITGIASRARSHQMRAAHDAVLVGVGTVLADDPLLTARGLPLPKRQPIRIVADSKARTPVASRLVQSAGLGRVVIATAELNAPRELEYLAAGAECWSCGGSDGRVDPLELFRRAEVEGIGSIFLEGGGQLAASFMKAGCIDRLEWFRAPILIGGDGYPALGDLGLTSMDGLPRWHRVSSEVIGEDTLETWHPA